MKEINFCGITDALDCANDELSAAKAAINRFHFRDGLEALERSIKHTEYVLKRINECRDNCLANIPK